MVQFWTPPLPSSASGVYLMPKPFSCLAINCSVSFETPLRDQRDGSWSAPLFPLHLVDMHFHVSVAFVFQASKITLCSQPGANMTSTSEQISERSFSAPSTSTWNSDENKARIRKSSGNKESCISLYHAFNVNAPQIRGRG